MLLEALAVVPHVPNNQLQTAPTMTDQKSATTRWWNGWYTTFVAFLGAYAAYIVFIIGRTTHGLSDAAPRPWNAIALTALSLGAVLSYIAADRLNRRRNEADWRNAVITAINAVAASRPARSDEEPTVPLAGRVYAATALHGSLSGAASVAVAAVQHPGANPEVVADQIEERVVRRVQGRIDEARDQGHWAGYSACARDGLAGVGATEVKHLPGARNGGPSSS